MPKKHKPYYIPPAKQTTGTRISMPIKESIPITQQIITFSIECCMGKCCFNKITDFQEKAGFASRLHELSQLTWGDIKQTSRKSLGYETLDHVNLTSNKFPKGARRIGFVYHDNHRMIGYRDENGVFHILWFDYDGKQYAH